MRIEKVFFKSIDNLNLAGLLHTPEKGTKTDTVVIDVHGITSNCLKYREDMLSKGFTDMNIAYFSFNNRGHDIINTYDKIVNNEINYYGSSAENIYDSYYDIKSAILEMQARGYKKIILEGHSMGCTKVVYTYNEFILNNEKEILDSIISVILLSMVDIPTAIKNMVGKNYKRLITYLMLLSKRGKGNNLLIIDNSFPPIKPNTILAYVQDNKKIDFARFGDKRYSFKELNNINIPLFMRWGNVNELIFQDVEELVKIMNDKIKNPYKDISYIKGADHSYTGKENVLTDEICKFIKKNLKGILK